jgi:hypothetical protein
MNPFHNIHGKRAWTLTAVIIAVGLTVSAYGCVEQIASSQTQLRQRAQTVANLLPVQSILALKGNRSDFRLDAYQQLHKRLQDVKETNDDLRYVYLAGLNKNNEVYFAVDAQQEDAPDFSAPGEIYPESSSTFRNLFFTKSGIVEGPLPDQWGIWYSGLAPVVDPRTGRTVAVLGLDKSAVLILLSAVIHAIIPIVLVFFIISGLIIKQGRMENSKNQVILFQRLQAASYMYNGAIRPIGSLIWALKEIKPLIKKTADKRLTRLYGELISQSEAMHESVGLSTASLMSDREIIAKGQYKEEADVIELINTAVNSNLLTAVSKSVSLRSELVDAPSYSQPVYAGDIVGSLTSLVGLAVDNSSQNARIEVKFIETYSHWQVIIESVGDVKPITEVALACDIITKGSIDIATVSEEVMTVYVASQVAVDHGGVLVIKNTPGQKTAIELTIPNLKHQKH